MQMVMVTAILMLQFRLALSLQDIPLTTKIAMTAMAMFTPGPPKFAMVLTITAKAVLMKKLNRTSLHLSLDLPQYAKAIQDWFTPLRQLQV
jgi:hypothetical protein